MAIIVRLIRFTCFLAGTGLCLSPGQARAVGLSVRVARSGVSTVTADPLKGKIVAVPVAVSEATPTRLEAVMEREMAALDLKAGSWELRAEIPGYWGPSKRVYVEEGTSLDVDLPVWPAGALTASFQVGGEKALVPKRALIHFRRSPANDEVSAPEGGDADCTFSAGRVDCIVPVGRFDVEVRCDDFIPRYLFDVAVARGQATRLGPLQLRRGGSITGRVITQANTVPREECSAELRTPFHSAVGAGRKARSPQAYRTVVSNTRGFFQFIGTEPASYVLEVRCGAARASQALELVSRDELALQEPLVLSRQSTLSLRLDPASDPWGGSWTVSLVSSSGGEIVAEGPASREGEWSSPELPEGKYQAQFRTGQGLMWYSKEVDSTESSGPFEIALPSLRLQGTVRLGNRPLAAEIRFGDRHSSQFVVLQSGDDGRFGGYLPKPIEALRGLWDVEVEAPGRGVKRTIRGVRLNESADGTEAQVDLLLPGVHLVGSVVDEQERPVAKADVHIHNLEDGTESRLSTDLNGAFTVEGLGVGQHYVYATASKGRSRREYLTFVEEALNSVRLVVQPFVVTVGRVLSDQGYPVPGAKILTVLPSGPRSLLDSDVTGSFKFTFEPDENAVGLAIAMPGYAVTIGRYRPTENGDVVARIGRLAGTLVLDVPSAENFSRSRRMPILLHGGSYANWTYLQLVGVLRSNELGGLRVALEAAEPGLYSLCLATANEYRSTWMGAIRGDLCKSGTLAEGGELLLDVAVPKDARERVVSPK